MRTPRVISYVARVRVVVRFYKKIDIITYND